MSDFTEQYIDDDEPPQVPGYGPVRRLRVHFVDFIAFCRHRRIVGVTVYTERGYYLCDFQDPVPAPPDLTPAPEQLERDEPSQRARKPRQGELLES